MRNSGNQNQRPRFVWARRLPQRSLPVLLMCISTPALLSPSSAIDWAKEKKTNEEEARKLFPTVEDARKFARGQQGTYVGSTWPQKRWYDYLPPCPDREADIDPDEWQQETHGLLAYYHSDAASYRAKRHFRAANQEGLGSHWHGQQACYRGGVLITDPNDPGAGSPDFVGPGGLVSLTTLGTILRTRDSHFGRDIAPWEVLGFKEYNRYWRTQGGTAAAFNVLVGRSVSDFVDGSHPKRGGDELEKRGWRDTLLNVNIGDVILFHSEGVVVWGQLDENEKCDADGDPATEGRRLLREILAPRPFSKERIGALMGAVVSDDALPAPNKMPGFKIGNQLSYTVRENGRLWIGINDSMPSNNSGYFNVEIRRVPSAKAN